VSVAAGIGTAAVPGGARPESAPAAVQARRGIGNGARQRAGPLVERLNRGIVCHASFFGQRNQLGLGQRQQVIGCNLNATEVFLSARHRPVRENQRNAGEYNV
jgi:hypothetical protein